MRYLVTYKTSPKGIEELEVVENEDLPAFLHELYAQDYGLGRIIPTYDEIELHSYDEEISHPLALSALHLGQNRVSWSYGDWRADSSGEILSALDKIWESRRE